MKYKSITLFLFISTLISLSLTTNVPSSTSYYLTTADKVHLKKIIEPGFQLQELSDVYYAVSGYKYLKENIVKVAETCEFLIKSAGEYLTTEQIYYLASTWKSLERCQTKSLPINEITKKLTSVLEKDSSLSEIYYAINALISFGKKINEATITNLVKNLQTLLKKDESPLSLGYIFHIAAHLGVSGNFALNHLETAILQADEVNGQFLQFDGGLSITSFVVNGIYKFSSVLKKKPPLTSQQIIKLANYFLSRRSVQTPKGVINFLSSISVLANNEFEKPICIALSENGIVSTKQPLVYIKVCDLFGNSLKSANNVIANTVTKIEDNIVISDKKNFNSTLNDKTLFTLNFMDFIPEPGFYKIKISVGSITNVVFVKVLAEVEVDYLEVGTADADQISQPKLLKVTPHKKLNKKIEADFQQKVVIRFLLKDSFKNKTMTVHQAFVRLSALSSLKNKQEIIFVAEADSSHIYKFDMPVGTVATNFDYQSGDYNIELIIGDILLSNSFQWTLTTVNLKFPETIGSDIEKSIYQLKHNIYSPKIEIKHMFREPEKRPPAFVSNLFTALCLSPILLLLILWAKLGVNISNFSFTLSAIFFHLGLGSIFVLFGIFWLKLNMFVTLQYLFGLGLVTFLSGNKLLAQIASNRKTTH